MFTWNKCKLVALLDEKVRDLEQRVATLKAIREDEAYIDRTLEQQQLAKRTLLMEENQNTVVEKNAGKTTNIVEEPQWKRITVRSKRRRRHSFPVKLYHHFQLLEEECVRQDAEETP